MSARLIASAAVLAGTVLAGQALAQDVAPAAETTCRPANLADFEGWQGIWMAQNMLPGINGRDEPGEPSSLVSAQFLGFEAPWTKEGWITWEKWFAWGASNPEALQKGWGYPVMMSSPAPFKVVISPAETVIASQYREIRYIPTDGRDHPPEDELWATNWGDSVGCWKDDTLVIDTVAVNYDPGFNFAAPPLSEEAHFVERIRLAAPGRLESEVTITDPATLERPWKVHQVYVQHPVLTRLVHEGDMTSDNRIVAREGAATIAPIAEPQPPPSLEEQASLTAEQMARVAGRYAIEPQGFTATFEPRGSLMFVSLDPIQPFPIPVFAEGPLDFRDRFLAIGFHFETNGDGQVTGFTSSDALGQTLKGTRLPD